MTFPVNFRILSTTFLAALVMIAGCSSTPKPTDTTSKQAVSSTDEQIFVGDSVEMNYDPNVIMKRAESFFDKESYAESIVEYKHFLDLHRNHVLAPYAQYKIGVSHFKQYRTVDRDPEPLDLAIQNFDKLLQEFPASRYETEAKQTILICKEQLAQRHLMVGQFYLNRDSYLAAAHRFEKIIKEFPELETAGDAMFHLAKTYQDLGIEEWSQEWLLALVNEHPNNSYHSDGQKLLAKLQKKNPTFLASLPHDPSMDEQTDPNPLTIEQKPENQTLVRTVSHSPESPLLSSVGTPSPALTPTTLSDSIASKPPVSDGACTIGTWCDSPSSTITTPPTQLSSNVKSCKTGEWC
ncbi:MAG TPA: outer membrane protein assembly factor BamD [Nitrospirales bacterium]|nr:outer membrane protein assembly factor BamD [Nitrospirales bacterium]